MLTPAMAILAQTAGAAGTTAGPAGGSPGGSPFASLSFFFWIIAIFAIIYFLMIRPQKKKEQQRKSMLDRLQKGDQVVTIGGLYGEVESIKGDYVIVLVDRASGHTLKFRRGAIHEILPKDSDSAEEKS
jgi:preprotein translocase subunit YajC